MIEKIADLSEVPVRAQERAQESVSVWRVGYGGANDSTGRTLAYFGVIAINALCAQGVVWFALTPEGARATRSQIRAAVCEWRRFVGLRAWSLFAYCGKDEHRNARFLRFAGFSPLTEDEESLYFERSR